MFWKKRTTQHSPLLFEELEPRLLFSADGLGALAGVSDIPDAYPAAHVLVVDSDLKVHAANETRVQDYGSDNSVQQRLELVFVDSNTPDHELLLADLLGQKDENRRFEIIMLDANRDGIEQITDVLGHYSGVDAIHIVSHGDAGQVQLGNTTLSEDNLNSYQSELWLWGAALGDDADILIYGCKLAATDAGQSLVSNLASFSSADVAASEDLTGHVSFGGDWDLEFQVGVIETDIAFGSGIQQQWNSVLAGSWFDADTGAPRVLATNGDDIFMGDGTNEIWVDGWNGDDVLYGNGGVDNLIGNDGNDLILGGDGNDFIFGGDDDDVLHGGLGDDLIEGGDDADTLIGGGGNDTLNGGNEDDLFLFSGAQNGDIYDVNGGNESDTIDVSAFVSAVDNGSTITVQMGAGDLFTINYTNVETIVEPGDSGNKAPVAQAGSDQAVATGALVTLDASASSDPDPETPTYSWQQISGPWVTLSNSTAAMPTFTAPGSAAVLEFALVAADASISDVDVVRITVGGGNVSPTADAGGSYVINEGDSLLLDATGSSDSDGSIVEYRWDLNNDLDHNDYTSASATPTLDWATIATWGLDDGDVGGKAYTIGLQVLDNQGATHEATTTVTINDTAPTLTTTGTGAATPGGAYTLNLSAADAGTDTIAGWTINWGDGAIDTFAGNPAAVTHTYNGEGFTYNILASATDEDGTHLQNEFVVASGGNDRVLRYGPDGSFLQAFATSDGSDYPVDAVIGPDGNLYLSGWRSDDVLRYNAATGTFMDPFVAAGTEGLNSAAGLAFGPDGHLYVASRLTSEVLRFDGSSGAFIDAFVTTRSGGLSEPEGLVFSADGDLYVSDYSNHAVYRYDGTTGDFVSIFVSSRSGGLDGPEDLTFGPDGHLYVASDFDSSVLRYNGATGALIDAFVPSGSNGLSSATGVGFGPDGHLYVSSWSSNEVLRFDGSTGAFIDAFISAGSGGLASPDYFSFIPQHQVTVASGQTISGTVFEDIDGDGDIVDDGTGSAGVTVGLYVDDGSVAGEIDSGDSMVASATTDGSGDYSFSGLSDATYWVIVDSATIDPDAGFNVGFLSGDAWAEQTYGVAGSVAFAGSYSYAAAAGARYGGMQSEASDNAAALTSAEHVTRVIVAGSDVANVDSGFSFNVITSTGDDSAPSGSSIQGSLRQFLFNSNAIDSSLHGPNSSHFAIPTTDSNYNGSGNGEFTITPTAALPGIVDSVVLDATTQAGYSTPIVELVGTLAGSANGLTISGNDSTIRGLVINRFAGHGIQITGDNNHIESSYIGLDASGSSSSVGNSQLGIQISNATGNVIGGSGVGNVVSGNGFAGIAIVGGGSNNNVIQGNLIGTDATGMFAIGNSDYGIDIWNGGPDNNTIGGITADLRNVIAGNGWAGVHLSGGTGNIVQGNYIGTNITATAGIANGGGPSSNIGGIAIDGGAANNSIGGTADGAGNLIAFNIGPGVRVDGATTTGNMILENEIHANSDVGIALNAGGNQSRQRPVLSIAVTDGVGSVTITGTYSDASLGADPAVIIDFFSNPGNDQEGRTYLGSDTFSTIASGDGLINSSISATVAVGEYITATVTDSAGNTSEFSATQAASATPNSAPTLSGGPYNLGSTDEDTINVGTQVSTILGSLTTSDVDGDTLGLAVIAASGNGGWAYSTDSTDGTDGNWTFFGPVASNNALLLSNTSWVRYVPDNQNGESVDVSFHAWDGSTGSASTTGSPSTSNPAGGGGITAYSTGTAQANLTVTNANDAPIATNLASASLYNEGAASVAITDIVVSDVDTGEAITATLTLANTATGSLSTNDGATYTAGSGVWTITGTVANVNTALANLVFNPLPDNDLDTTIAVSIDDGDEDATGPLIGSISLNVKPDNDPPTLALNNTVVLLTENTDTTTRIRVANIDVADDGIGSNILSLAGNNTALFEIDGGALYLQAGVLLDFETQNRLDVTVLVDDPTIGNGPDDTTDFAVAVDDVNEAPAMSFAGNSVDENTDTTGGYVVGVLSASDPDIGDLATFTVIGGADQDKFSINNGNELVLSDGQLDFENQATYEVIVRVTDAGNLQQSQTVTISVNDQTEAAFVSDGDETTTVTAPTVGNSAASVIEANTISAAPVNTTIVASSEAKSNSEALPGGSGSAEMLAGEDIATDEFATVEAGILLDGQFDWRFVDAALAQSNNNLETGMDRPGKNVNLKQLVKAIANLNPATRLLAEAATSLEDAFDFSSIDTYSIVNSNSFRNDLNDFRKELQDEARRGQTVVGSAVAASTGISIGYVVWLIRGGVVLSSVLSSLPAWRLIDPLPVLATVLGDPENEDDDESLASMLEREATEHQQDEASRD